MGCNSTTGCKSDRFSLATHAEAGLQFPAGEPKGTDAEKPPSPVDRGSPRFGLAPVVGKLWFGRPLRQVPGFSNTKGFIAGSPEMIWKSGSDNPSLRLRAALGICQRPAGRDNGWPEVGAVYAVYDNNFSGERGWGVGVRSFLLNPASWFGLITRTEELMTTAVLFPLYVERDQGTDNLPDTWSIGITNHFPWNL